MEEPNFCKEKESDRKRSSSSSQTKTKTTKDKAKGGTTSGESEENMSLDEEAEQSKEFDLEKLLAEVGIQDDSEGEEDEAADEEDDETEGEDKNEEASEDGADDKDAPEGVKEGTEGAFSIAPYTTDLEYDCTHSTLCDTTHDTDQRVRAGIWRISSRSSKPDCE
jgi:hypothetical protein